MSRALRLVAFAAFSFNLFSCSDDSESTPEEQPEEPGFAIKFVGDGVKCGAVRCQSVAVEGSFPITVNGCCANKGASECGINLGGVLGALAGLRNAGCEALNSPGSEAENCEPSEPIQVAVAGTPEDGIVLEPCCRQNGECGFNTSFAGIGLGCVDPELFDQESSGACEFTADN